MKAKIYFISIVFLSVFSLKGQQSNIFCAANSLSVTEKICIEVTETPVHVYKNYLQYLAKIHGTDSPEFLQDIPDFKVWSEAFSTLSPEELYEKFFETDEMALLAVTSVSQEQVNRFLRWKTEQMKAELAKMSKRDRAEFPENFRFRLPTAKEWGFMRFRVQEKQMINQIEDMANVNEKVFKSKRSKVLKDAIGLSSIYTVLNEKRGYYNAFTNVLEMTRGQNTAVGGDAFMVNAEEDYLKVFNIAIPHARVGFRAIFEIYD